MREEPCICKACVAERERRQKRNAELAVGKPAKTYKCYCKGCQKDREKAKDYYQRNKERIKKQKIDDRRARGIGPRKVVTSAELDAKALATMPWRKQDEKMDSSL